jgi:hypothetical protein
MRIKVLEWEIIWDIKVWYIPEKLTGMDLISCFCYKCNKTSQLLYCVISRKNYNNNISICSYCRYIEKEKSVLEKQLMKNKIFNKTYNLWVILKK